uniref:Uncharacterized protein n=1 Tax=Vibrio genomosp. F6 TaxID=723172 RepID=A0A0H3ZZZ9_9VIBR|nr:hypothetical protein [Vibrio genomosp. F6]
MIYVGLYLQLYPACVASSFLAFSAEEKFKQGMLGKGLLKAMISLPG